MKLKKVFSVAAAALMLIAGSGCGGKTSSASSKYVNLGLPTALEITNSDFFYSAAGDSTVDDRDEWTDAMTERYGVDISVDVPVDEDAYSDFFNKAITGEYSGIMKLNGYSELLYMINKGAILPLDDYLANNKAWQILPEEMRKMYEINGHVWAIPSSFYYELGTRGFRTDWLQQLGLSTPQTVDELVEFAKAFAASDIEGEAVATCQTLIWALDIFEAYGMYLDGSGQLPYGYDPDLDSISDAFLKPEAEQAFTALRQIYQAGGMDKLFDVITSSDLDEDMMKGKFGTAAANGGDMKYYYGLYSKAEAIYDATSVWPSTSTQWNELTTLYDEVIALKGTKTTEIQELYPVGKPYVLLKNTAQPAETVNFFTDLLFSSEDNYLEASVGLAQNYIKNADGTITLKSKLDLEASKELSSSIYIARVRSNLVGRIDGLYSASEATVISGTDENVVQHRLEIEKYKDDQLKTAEDQDLVVKVPTSYAFPNSDFLMAHTAEIAAAFKTCFTDAITSDSKSVREVLDEYKVTMAGLGAGQVLIEANKAIGKTVKQTY